MEAATPSFDFEAALRCMFPGVQADVVSAVLANEGKLTSAVEVLLLSSGQDERRGQIQVDEQIARQLQERLRSESSASWLDFSRGGEDSGPAEEAWESFKSAMSDVTRTVSCSLSTFTSNISSWLTEDEEGVEDESSHFSGAVDESGCPFLLPPSSRVVDESKKQK